VDCRVADKKERKALSRAAPRKRRLSKVPTMVEDLAAIARFLDAYKALRESGANVRFTRICAEFLDTCSLEQWEAVMELLKHALELPTEDRMTLLHSYFGQSPPELFREFEAASAHPMFAALTEMSPQSPCQQERAPLRTEAKEAATFWLSDTMAMSGSVWRGWRWRSCSSNCASTTCSRRRASAS
jgi:hypothetical protein